MKNPQEVVKCACGLPMRKKEWKAHWRSCHKASSVEVTKQDVKDLETYERRKQL